MRSEEENLQALSRAVQESAHNDAERILAEAGTKAEEIRRRGREQAAAQRKEILDRAAREAERLRSQALAAARMKARTMMLERRERLLARVFTEAEQRIPSIPERPEYGSIVRRLVREASDRLSSDAVRIRADERTRKLFTDAWLESISKETAVGMQPGPALAEGTGVIVETADGHRQYNNTLETRLDRMRNRLRSAAFRLLEGKEP
jgi:vacuolar-type H+-ATPase subunit E/Vma4